MQEKLTKEEEGPPQSVDCSADTCKFPQTCKWNLKCMQRGLNLSMREKKMKKPMDNKRPNGADRPQE